MTDAASAWRDRGGIDRAAACAWQDRPISRIIKGFAAVAAAAVDASLRRAFRCSASRRIHVHYQHVKVPAGGQKITVNKDFSLNVPDNPIIPYIEGDGTGFDITPVMIKVVDAAVAKAYGGKRKIHWMEIYAGEKSTKVYGPDVWLPDETLDDPQGLRRVDQGAADDAGRRRHPLAQRRAAPAARPLRLPAPGALLQGRAHRRSRSPRRSTW